MKRNAIRSFANAMETNVKLVIILLSISFLAVSCKKDCFDQALYDQYQVIDCTADCPGVTGCDGNTYCNACVANQNGIAIE